MTKGVNILYFKGSLAASLVAEKIVLARNHSRQKHLSVAFISIGIVIVTLESGRGFDNQASFSDWCIGIIMLLTSLILSSLMGVHQERIYAKWGKHYQEALFFTVSLTIQFLNVKGHEPPLFQHFLPLPGFGLLYQDIILHFTKIVQSGPISISGYQLDIPCMMVYLIGNIGAQYFCAKSIFKLSSSFTSLTITCLLTLRKFFSILISVIVFDNLFTMTHWIGTIFVFFGIILFSEISIKKRIVVKNKCL